MSMFSMCMWGVAAMPNSVLKVVESAMYVVVLERLLCICRSILSPRAAQRSFGDGISPVLFLLYRYPIFRGISLLFHVVPFPFRCVGVFFAWLVHAGAIVVPVTRVGVRCGVKAFCMCV